jgi:hypothetical protein|nr:MAG TPA: hypothetical protein [Caudoviricetes sp.]
MYIKVNRRNRPDCVKVTNNNVIRIDPFAIFSPIKDALKNWEKLDCNAVRLKL